jgi:transcription elongation factor S-II
VSTLAREVVKKWKEVIEQHKQKRKRDDGEEVKKEDGGKKVKTEGGSET